MRPFTCFLRTLPVQRARLYFSTSPRVLTDLNPQEPYRNRYTHFREAYPGKPNYARNFYRGSLIIVVAFFLFGGGSYLDKLEAQYIANEKKKRKELLKKVNCQVKTHLETSESDEENEAVVEKKRPSFRERKFIAYEDRIRSYSTPDKIFRYFATLKATEEDGDVIYMTPDDFLRAITPGQRQPEGLDLDSFMRYDPKKNRVSFKHKDPSSQTTPLNLNISKDSIFYRLCDKALLTFTDFIFLLTVLSTPRRQFELAFKMFDLNGDGEVDADEFDVVCSVIMGTSSVGRRHRDHATTKSTIKKRSNSALQQYFFGPDGTQKLTINRFLDFHSQLQDEIIKLEFNRAHPKDGKITELQFANFLLVYAGFSEPKRRKMIRRVKQAYEDSDSNQGINYQDFANFNHLLRSIGDVDTALTFHHMAGAAIDKDTLAHVALSVANVKLSPHVIDVVFTLFDENDDGQLSQREFVEVMRNRFLRGLDKPMDTGFVRFLDALYMCAKEQVHLPSALDRRAA